MTLKKTIAISIVFHICFFSAALLLFEGSGKLSETEVVFISLAADEPRVVKAENRAASQKVQAVKKVIKPPVTAKEKETVKADVVAEKTEDKTPEEVVKIESEEPVTAGVSSLNEGNDHSEAMEMAQAAHDQPFSAGWQGTGLLPETIELISMAIERVKTYPVIARKRGIEGTVHVSFNIMADGNPHGIKIMKSSGFSILDRATVTVVKKAAPFPLVANRIELPVAYRLRN